MAGAGALLLPLRSRGLSLGTVEHLRCHISECRSLWRMPRARRPLKDVLAHIGLRVLPRRLRLARGTPSPRLPRSAPIAVFRAQPLPLNPGPPG